MSVSVFLALGYPNAEEIERKGKLLSTISEESSTGEVAGIVAFDSKAFPRTLSGRAMGLSAEDLLQENLAKCFLAAVVWFSTVSTR